MKLDRSSLPYLAGMLFLLVAPTIIYPLLIVKVLCFALFACAVNLLLGYTGLLSFGHAAFFGGAAYFTAHALKAWQAPPLLGLLIGTLGAGALGLLVGAVAIRRQGIYFAMVTLALAQLLYFLFEQMPFTGGDDGLQGVPRGALFGFDLADDTHLYYLAATLFAGAFWLILRVIDSPFGQILKAIRDNEARVTSLGYNVRQYKLLAFVLSAALAGLAGALKTLAFNFATLSDAHWHTSGEVVLMTLLGGLGTVFGPVTGASLIVVLHNELADKVGSLIDVMLGVMYVVCVLSFRRGIIGEGLALYRRMLGQKLL